MTDSYCGLVVIIIIFILVKIECGNFLPHIFVCDVGCVVRNKFHDGRHFSYRGHIATSGHFVITGTLCNRGHFLTGDTL